MCFWEAQRDPDKTFGKPYKIRAEDSGKLWYKRREGMNVKRLPIGYDSFEKIRTEKSYYVDKTYFIKEFLKSHGEVERHC